LSRPNTSDEAEVGLPQSDVGRFYIFITIELNAKLFPL